MKTVNDMISRMNARLAKIEHDQTQHPGWLTRLMLADAARNAEPGPRDLWREIDRRRDAGGTGSDQAPADTKV